MDNKNDDSGTTNKGFDPTLLESVLLKLQQQRDKNDRDNNYDYLRRTSLQYHWINRNPRHADGRRFESFDDYLACFRSKRRIAIRRERAIALNSDNQRIRIDGIAGTDILKVNGLVERMFELYLSTVEKQLYWGRQYLTLEFFQRLCFHSSFIHNLCFMCVRNVTATESNGDDNDDEVLSGMRAEDVFAGTLNVVKDGVFYGRYWGCLPGYEVKNLHFETCYWSAIEYCITNGLDRMEPGAGGAGTWRNDTAVSSMHVLCGRTGHSILRCARPRPRKQPSTHVFLVLLLYFFKQITNGLGALIRRSFIRFILFATHGCGVQCPNLWILRLNIISFWGNSCCYKARWWGKGIIVIKTKKLSDLSMH